jgi:hypothetical protein
MRKSEISFVQEEAYIFVSGIAGTVAIYAPKN